MIGGYLADGSSSSRVDLFSPARNGWRRLPDLPVRVNHAMAAAYHGRLYVVGGYGEAGPLRSVFSYSDGRWHALAPLPAARAAAGAGVVGARLIVAGGVGPNGLARRAFALDLRRGRWSVVPGPTPREHLGVTALHGRVYAVGGRRAGFDTNVALVESWAPAARRWRSQPSLPRARGGTAVAAVSGSIVSAGGEEPGGTMAEVYVYRPGGSSWARLADLPTPRHGLALGGLAGRVYAAAGGPMPGLHVSSTNEFLAVGRWAGATFRPSSRGRR